MKKYTFKPDGATKRMTSDDSKRYFSTIGFATFAYIVISFVTVNASVMALAAYAPSLIKNEIVYNSLLFVCQYLLPLIAISPILSKLPRDIGGGEPFGFGGFAALCCISVTFIMVGNTLSQYLAMGIMALSGSTPENPVVEATTGGSLIFSIAFTAVLVPIAEELIFRKLFCDRLLPLGEGYAILISALIFGFAHGNIYQIPYAFFTGLLFGYVYVRTGKVIYSILIHMGINGIFGIFAGRLSQAMSKLLTEEWVKEATEALESDSQEVLEAFVESSIMPNITTWLLYFVYTVGMYALSFAGLFLLMRKLPKIKLREGLLPPAKEGRIGNFFCNIGIAAAITAITLLVVVSLV